MQKEIKRIIMPTQHYFPDTGGITTWCYETAKAIQDKGLELIILTKAYDGFDKLNELHTDEYGLQVIRLDNRKWKNNRNSRVYKAIKPFISDDTAFLSANWKMAVPCMLASLTNDIRYYTVVHGLDAMEARKINRGLQKITLRRSSGIIAVSRFTANLLKKVIMEEVTPVRIINNGVDTARFHTAVRDKEIESKYGFKDGLRILSLGRIIKRKGFDMTIKAMAQIKDPDVHYYIGGKGGYENHLRHLVKEYNLEDRVHFLGFIPDEDMNQVFNCADIFSMPSRSLPGDVEGFGITYLEAAACGVPSVAGRKSGAEDAVIHKETGLLVDPESVGEIADAIKHLCYNKEDREHLGNNAQKRVRQFLSWDIVTEKIITFMTGREDKSN